MMKIMNIIEVFVRCRCGLNNRLIKNVEQFAKENNTSISVNKTFGAGLAKFNKTKQAEYCKQAGFHESTSIVVQNDGERITRLSTWNS